MGWFRRSLRMGPLRLNLSPSGVGLSAGIRGARVSVGPRGTYVTLSAGGFQYRRKVDDAPDGVTAPSRGGVPGGAPGWAPPGPGWAGPPQGAIVTASVEALQAVSPDNAAAEIQACAGRADLFKVYWISSLVVLFLMLFGSGWAALVLALALAGGGAWVYRWNAERRTARFIYDVDDPAAMERLAHACAIGESLSRCATLWHVHHATATGDAKRNAGATTLIRRTPVRCSDAPFPNVETNVGAYSVVVGPQKLLFLPDRLIVREGDRVGAVPYEHLSASGAPITFVEAGPVPPDGQVIDHTWRYVNKSGGPDMRFNNNVQIPVLRYGEVIVQSPHGIQIVFQTSNLQTAMQAAYAVNQLSARARQSWAPTVAPPASGRRVSRTVAMETAPAAASIPASPAPPPAPPVAFAYGPPPATPSYSPDPVPTAPRSQRVVAFPAPPQSLPVQAAPPPVQSLPVQSPPLPAPPSAWTPPAPSQGPYVPPVGGAPPPSAWRAAPPQAASPRIARWLEPGRPVEVAGYSLPGGMLYVGEGLSPVRELRDVEPALIQPGLPVDRLAPNRTGEGMPYWPSYSSISPRDRAAYLEWLAGGRQAPNAYVGHVFLFFYGLERRALADARHMPVLPEERLAIRSEVERLLGIYGDNSSFRGYATEFLGAMWMGSDVRLYEHLPPPSSPSRGDLPLLLRLGLGQIARDGRPVPADWALSWTLCDPTVSLPTAVRRCLEETRALFRVRYRQAFGDGFMITRPSSRDLTASYRPASASFGGELTLTAPGVPDVTARRRPAEKFLEVLQACAGELDAFSRWIGKNPDRRETLAAAALLPAEILDEHQGSEVKLLCQRVEQQLTGRDTALVKTTFLSSADPVKADWVLLAQLLQKKRFGLEPDVRFGAELPKPGGQVVLFRLPADAPSVATEHYTGASLLVQLAVGMAAADGHISDAEQRQIDSLVTTMDTLSPAERARLLGRAHLLAAEPPTLTRLKKRLSALDSKARNNVADMLVAMAGADGRIDPAELKMLAKIFPLLGFDASDAYRRIHAFAGSTASVTPEPITVRGASPAGGVPIPAAAKAPEAGVVLDMRAVQAKLAESAQVAALLGSIFAEEEPVPSTAAPGRAVDSPPDVAPVKNLDARHSAFVRALAGKPSWTRGELEKLAGGLGLLPDGAVEVVNEAAFDACGGAVAEGDDPVLIDGDIMKELLT